MEPSTLNCALAMTVAALMVGVFPKTAPAAGAPPPTPPESEAAVNPNKPFSPARVGALYEPPYRPAQVARVEGTHTGGINAPGDSIDYFRAPGFDKGENDGRLYFFRILGKQKNGATYRFGYVQWRPLDATANTYQRFLPVKGHDIEEFETDGSRLKVHHYPPWPSKAKSVIQIFRWKGDAKGNGEWVYEKTRPGPSIY